jgi:DnaJ-class molecular chaperone
MSALQELGLTDDATPTEVKRKYYELVQIHHPDKGGQQADFNHLVETYRRALAEAEAPRLCQACHGLGKVAQGHGFETTYFACARCGGLGQL